MFVFVTCKLSILQLKINLPGRPRTYHSLSAWHARVMVSLLITALRP